MTRKYVVTLEDTLKGWQEDEDELERKYGAEPLDCGNCEIVQASINAGIRTASRLVDDTLNKIRAEIKEWYWQADKQALAKDPCVVDAMIDLFFRTTDKYKESEEV